VHAIILAAGVGRRLNHGSPLPKCLLEFGGLTLLARHCRNLSACGIERLSLCVGYEAAQVATALRTITRPATLLHYNPLYTLGSSLSLWSVRQALAAGDDVLVMDADVLYHPDILRRLVLSPARNCFLMDRDFAPGDEPVKICLDGERIVEFRKRVAAGLHYDRIGESVGFFKFDAATALQLACLINAYVADGRREQPHEEALRDLALSAGVQIGVEDITGLPWLEIDFPEDLIRAEHEIMPLIDVV
jgi:choline kinase